MRNVSFRRVVFVPHPVDILVVYFHGLASKLEVCIIVIIVLSHDQSL